MKAAEIRKIFLDFFEERGHRVVPSSSLVPDDPSLLLTNAGMVQFKPYFLGVKDPTFPRATSVQKCVRTTDIDSVGKTARHITFFEMLGNFSFGDYYKEKAIPWAWELLTERFSISPSSLWVSVYTDDDEAASIWKEVAGVDAGRIIRLGAEDNFWDMGPTGPCGPCSEIIFDRGEEFACGPSCSPGCDCDRYLELWNLVFMQYERKPDGTLLPLPARSIDTGLGLERVAAVKQGVPTVFETDILRPLIDEVESLSGIEFGSSANVDVRMKIIADHSRAAAFLVADGVFPSNEGRGYVLRRLIRRSARHSRLLGIEGPFAARLARVVAETQGDAYQELAENLELIEGVMGSEEERFSQTLKDGMALIKRVIEEKRAGGEDSIDGETAFYLYDTLGFPLELTAEIAQDSGMKVDEEGFEVLMERQRAMARSSAPSAPEQAAGRAKTDFVGYQSLEAKSKVLEILEVLPDGSEKETQPPRKVEVILDVTPFYAQSGGQVGDTGWITGAHGKVEVSDTHKGPGGTILHRGVLSGRLEVGEEVTASVDSERRIATARNHTATHILHWALREVLGKHVKQSGSHVSPERLRFDFTHHKAMTPTEIEEVEMISNDKILQDVAVEVTCASRDEAISSGAMALFGEKYADTVRVVSVGDFSRELCGGTHVERSGMIGPMRITYEGGIGAGLRRIEATTGFATIEWYKGVEKVAEEVAKALKVDLFKAPAKVFELRQKVKELEKLGSKGKAKTFEDTARDFIERYGKEKIDGYAICVGETDELPERTLRDMADFIMRQGDYAMVAIGSRGEEKATVVIKVAESLVKKGLAAKELARIVGEELGGGGGGKGNMAVAGGTNISLLPKALELVKATIAKTLGEGN